MASKTSLSGSVIDTIIKTRNLGTVLVECPDDDTSLTFHDTPLFSYYWYMLANLISITFYNTPIEIGLMSTKQGGKKA